MPVDGETSWVQKTWKTMAGWERKIWYRENEFKKNPKKP